MRAVHKRYLREFVPAMCAYVGLILLSGWLAPTIANRAARAALTVLPLLPVLVVIRAMVRVIRDQDELERRIDLEAIVIAASLTGFGFFSYGLLLAGRIWAAPSADAVAIWVMPCLFGSYGIAKAFVVWRLGRG